MVPFTSITGLRSTWPTTGSTNTPSYRLGRRMSQDSFFATPSAPPLADRSRRTGYSTSRHTKASARQTREMVPTGNLAGGELKYLCVPYNPGPPPTGDPNCTVGPSSLTHPVEVDSISTYLPNDYVATLTPAQIASLDQGCSANGTCPLGPGPNPLIANINPAYPNPLFSKYPLPNCTACGNATNGDGDGLNSAGFTFPGNDPTKHDTYIFKLDYKITASGN